MWKNILAIIVLSVLAFALLPFSKPIINEQAKTPIPEEQIEYSFPKSIDDLIGLKDEPSPEEGKRVVFPEFIQQIITTDNEVAVSMCLTNSDVRLYGVIPMNEESFGEYDLYSESGQKVEHCTEASGETSVCNNIVNCSLIYTPNGEGTEGI